MPAKQNTWVPAFAGMSGTGLLIVAALTPAFAGPSTQRPADAARVEQLRLRLLQMGADQASGEGLALGARAKLAALNTEERALSAKVAANRAQLTHLLSALQLMTRDPPPPLLISPRRANEAIRAAILMQAVEPELERRAEDLAKQAREIARVRRQAAMQTESLMLTESELAERRAAIQKLAQEKGALEESLDPSVKAAAETAEAAARGAPDPGTLIRRLSTSNATPAAATASATAAAAAGVDVGRLGAPAAGTLVRRFGQELSGRSRSEGLAWRTEPLAQVRAPAGGQVDYAGPLKGWGQVVVLHVDEHTRLVLTGLDRADTAAGRSVAAGEPVGLMGRAGKAAPELYLEVRRDGEPVDPARWLDAHVGAGLR